MEALSRQLEAAQIAFARVNEVADVLRHPHLRRVSVGSRERHRSNSLLRPLAFRAKASRTSARLPALGEHTERVRREFLG